MQIPSTPRGDIGSIMNQAKALGIIPASTEISLSSDVNIENMTEFIRGINDDREWVSGDFTKNSHVVSRAVTPVSRANLQIEGQFDVSDRGSTGGANDVFRGANSQQGTCLYVLCKYLGYDIDPTTTVPGEIPKAIREEMKKSKKANIGCIVYGVDDRRNHVMPVPWGVKSATVGLNDLLADASAYNLSCTITSAQEFFTDNNRFTTHKFYADYIESEDVGFGGDLPVPKRRLDGNGHNADQDTVNRRETVGRSNSIVDESVRSGSSNLGGGVVRGTRRTIRNLVTSTDFLSVPRGYAVAPEICFNNVGELYLKFITPELGYEILEFTYRAWNLPMDNKVVLKFAQDFVCAFVIARTASDKADYNAEFEIPVPNGVIVANMNVFSTILTVNYKLTRRRFTRGMSNLLREYISHPANTHVRAQCQKMMGAHDDYATLCFDGSDNCDGLTSAERQFADSLVSRNLFEDDTILAQGASIRIANGNYGTNLQASRRS